MAYLIWGFATIFFIYLVMESILVHRARIALLHVVHVNGTRGKSTVARMIDAGLRAGGFSCCCKTTGTVPSVICVSGEEMELRRWGRPNIKEQIAILRKAAHSKAQVLIVECMAVHPELQRVSQHRILKADIGVITNVRLDHTDVMGDTTLQIAEALANSIPESGVMFTAEVDTYDILRARAEKQGTTTTQVLPTEEDIAEFNRELSGEFAENISLALTICVHLGVARQTALEGISQYRRDPYAASLHRLSGGALFVNALSANDNESTLQLYDRYRKAISNQYLVLLLNCRRDRARRTAELIQLIPMLCPNEVWMLGPVPWSIRRSMNRHSDREGIIRFFRNADHLPLDSVNKEAVVFAAGNLAEEGRSLMEMVRKDGVPHVL